MLSLAPSPTPSADQPPSESDDQPPSKSHAQVCSSKSHAWTPSDDQPPSESDDQLPSVSDTQHLCKSCAQDVSESDDQLQITVEKKSNNSPVKANSLLATSDKHKRIREQADASYRQNDERMQVKYSKGKNKKVSVLLWVFACMQDFCVYDCNMQIQIFNVGDFVSVRIPRIEWSSTDSHRLPCAIVERLGETFHFYCLK